MMLHQEPSHLEVRFKDAGKRGDDGERFFVEFMKTHRPETAVTDVSKLMNYQNIGVDFLLLEDGKSIMADVKHNIRPDGTFFLELRKTKIKPLVPGWFLTSKSDRIYHVNAELRQVVWYNLNDLRAYIAAKNLDPKQRLVEVSIYSKEYRPFFNKLHTN